MPLLWNDGSVIMSLSLFIYRYRCRKTGTATPWSYFSDGCHPFVYLCVLVQLQVLVSQTQDGGVPVCDGCHTCVSLFTYRWWRCQKSRTVEFPSMTLVIPVSSFTYRCWRCWISTTAPDGIPVSNGCHTCVSLFTYRWWRFRKSRTASLIDLCVLVRLQVVEVPKIQD